MPETEESLRERALSAWWERRREMEVEAAQRMAEQKLRALQAATAWTVMVLADDGEIRSTQETADAAKRLGIEATEPRCVYLQWTCDITVDHMTFRWTSAETSPMTTKRFELVSECPDCGDEVVFGYGIANLTQLGTALDEQMHNPKAMHRCVGPNGLDDDGEPMEAPVSGEKHQDPADVLLDAIQGYVHAVVRAALEDQRGPAYVPSEEL